MSDSNSESNDLAQSSSGGGSPAAQAYREQLAKEGAAGLGALANAVDSAVAKPTVVPPVTETRVAERKKVNGRARLSMGGMQVAQGKMIDISVTGACVLVDDMIAPKKVFNLECSVFHDGKHHAFTVQAVSVYSVLMAGKGFKVGFQFGSRNPATTKAIEDLVNS